VLADGYSVISEWREVERHSLGLRYSPHPRWTFAVDVPWLDIDTNLRNAAGDSRIEVAELGDVTFGTTVRFMKKGDEELYLGLVASAPTGDYRESGRLGPGESKVRLPYPLQPGSGTWSLRPVVTYIGQHEQTSWGGQFRGVFWLEYNEEGYHPGNRLELTTWIAQGFGDWFVASVRMGYSRWGNYSGSDDAIEVAEIPSADSKRQRGRRLDIGPGVQLAVPGLDHARLSAELLWPVYQHLDGPQLESDALLHVGWRWSF
jgi:hypothetical protein